MSHRPDELSAETHDIRTSLCLIRGYVQLARKGMSAGRLESDAVIRCLDIALNQVDVISAYLDEPELAVQPESDDDRVVGDIGLVRCDASDV